MLSAFASCPRLLAFRTVFFYHVCCYVFICCLHISLYKCQILQTLTKQLEVTEILQPVRDTAYLHTLVKQRTWRSSWEKQDRSGVTGKGHSRQTFYNPKLCLGTALRARNGEFLLFSIFSLDSTFLTLSFPLNAEFGKSLVLQNYIMG